MWAARRSHRQRRRARDSTLAGPAGAQMDPGRIASIVHFTDSSEGIYVAEASVPALRPSGLALLAFALLTGGLVASRPLGMRLDPRGGK